jgi:hypothetical protein
MRFLIYIIILFFFFGCGLGNKSEILHPTPENLPSKGEKNTNIIDVENDSDKNANQHKAKQKFDKIQLASEIGQLYGEPNEIFGFIQSIIIDSYNRIYILDRNQQHIQVYMANGDYITRLGNKGQGPGEFEMAYSMDTYKDSLLYVSNGYRIEVFDISQDEIKFIETKKIDKSIRSLCVANDKLFINPTQLTEPGEEINEAGYKSMIYAYSLADFKKLFLFGKSYISSNPFLLDRLTVGSLSCNKSTSTVIFSFDNFQILHGYSAKDGNLEWQTRIDGLRLFRVVQVSKNGVSGLSFRQPDEYYDTILNPISYYDGYNIVQIERRYLDNNGVYIDSKILTLIIDSINGNSFKLDLDLPIVLNISRNLMATIDEDRVMSKIYNLN